VKILHCCLAAFYIDDFSYQENILPRLHAQDGHDVEIVASTETYLDKVRLGYTQPGGYVSSDGLKVTRLPYARWLPGKLARKLRIYEGLAAVIERFQPDVLFLHDCQFLSIGQVARYAERTGATVYVDCHTDFINSGRSFLSRHLLHGVIYRACVARILRCTRRFYATLPLRADFLQDVYGVPRAKIELLPFGVDDSRIDRGRQAEVRRAMRNELGLSESDRVFIVGGKIDRRKAIHTLVAAFTGLVDSGQIQACKLILFGKPEPGLQSMVDEAARHPSICYVDWIAAEHIHRYLWAADIAVFPGTHSVLWEEAIGLGLPCVFRRWPGIEHVDLGGNCILLDSVDESSLAQTLLSLVNEPETLAKMRRAAAEKGPQVFSYTSIARHAIATEQPLGPAAS
jgi:1,2-diacylglycerol 3-alpha-glucosyltransferase